MSKARVKISVKAGKSGIKLASANLRVTKTGGKPRITGKPVYQTKAQLHTRIYTTSGGQPRRD